MHVFTGFAYLRQWTTCTLTLRMLVLKTYKPFLNIKKTLQQKLQKKTKKIAFFDFLEESVKKEGIQPFTNLILNN